MAFSTSPTQADIRAKIDDKRKARKEATHLAIQEAAERIALTEGKGALTTKHLVSEAGVSERTIFNHFANIDEVLLSCLSLRLSGLFRYDSFPLGLSTEELPKACEKFLIDMIESTETDEALQQFVQLAMTMVDGKTFEESLGKEVLQTLVDQGWLLCNFIEENYPELTFEQRFSLAVYLNNAVFGVAMGMARYAHFKAEEIFENPASFSLQEMKENIVYAVKKTGEGIPVL